MLIQMTNTILSSELPLAFEGLYLKDLSAKYNFIVNSEGN